jgi:hypothetical protein
MSAGTVVPTVDGSPAEATVAAVPGADDGAVAMVDDVGDAATDVPAGSGATVPLEAHPPSTIDETTTTTSATGVPNRGDRVVCTSS